MANISRNNASVLMIISTLIIIFILVTFFVISENNFNVNLDVGAASANNALSANNLQSIVPENVEEEDDVASSFNNDRKQVFNLEENNYILNLGNPIKKTTMNHINLLTKYNYLNSNLKLNIIIHIDIWIYRNYYPH